MKKIYEHPAAFIESFAANEYVAACYSLSCKVGTLTRNPVDGRIWPSGYDHEEEHATSGTGNCSDAGANYLTVDSAGRLTSLEEWRSDLNEKKGGWLKGTVTGYDDLSGDGKCGPGDYISWNTTSKDEKRTWHHWGIAQVADKKHPNHS